MVSLRILARQYASAEDLTNFGMAKKELGQTPAPTVASAMSEGEGQEEDELKSLDQESDGKTSRTPSSGKKNRIINMYILIPRIKHKVSITVSTG